MSVGYIIGAPGLVNTKDKYVWGTPEDAFLFVEKTPIIYRDINFRCIYEVELDWNRVEVFIHTYLTVNCKILRKVHKEESFIKRIDRLSLLFEN